MGPRMNTDGHGYGEEGASVNIPQPFEMLLELLVHVAGDAVTAAGDPVAVALDRRQGGDARGGTRR